MSPKEEPPTIPGVATTVLSPGTRAMGELHSVDDLVLSGIFEGKLRVEKSLRILPEARIDGDVVAESILVLGRMQGTLHAQNRIEIRAGAIVGGEVTAPQIVVYEGVILNAKVHMTGPVPGAVPAPVPVPMAVPVTMGPPRTYLLPTLLRSYGEIPREEMEEAERATESFMRSMGFELETRAERADRSGALRPIFRSREPVPYMRLRESMQLMEHALRAATASDPLDPPVQGTGAAGAREVASALGRMRRAALVVGPVALTHLDENPGASHLAVRRRTLPEAAPTDSPDPASLLVSLQKLQRELLDGLS